MFHIPAGFGTVGYIWHPLLAKAGASLLKSPLVLPSDFFLFLRCEIVLDVKCLSNLLGCLAFDHVRNCLASQIQQVLDIQVVGRLFTSKTPIPLSTFVAYAISSANPQSLERCVSEHQSSNCSTIQQLNWEHFATLHTRYHILLPWANMVLSGQREERPVPSLSCTTCSQLMPSK